MFNLNPEKQGSEYKQFDAAKLQVELGLVAQ